jgi:hypothetical protein
MVYHTPEEDLMSRHEYFPGFYEYHCDFCGKRICDWLGNNERDQCLRCGADICKDCSKYYYYETMMYNQHNVLICNHCIENPDDDLRAFLDNKREYNKLRDRIDDLEDQLSKYHYKLKLLQNTR